MSSELLELPVQVLEHIWRDCLDENRLIEDDTERQKALLMRHTPEEYRVLYGTKVELLTQKENLSREKQLLVNELMTIGGELDEEHYLYDEELKDYEALCSKHNMEIQLLESIQESMTRGTLDVLKDKFKVDHARVHLQKQKEGANKEKILEKVKRTFEDAIIRDAKANRSTSSLLSLDGRDGSDKDSR